MTLKEMNNAVFRREPVPHVFFQPRFEPWFAWHKQFKSLPKKLEGMELRQAYDLIGASMRTVHYYTGQPSPTDGTYTKDVKITDDKQGEFLKRRYDTPHGSLFETHKFTVDETWRMIEHPAKTVDDLRSLKWLLQHHVISFSPDKFKIGADYIGDRGQPQFWVPKSPYFALAQGWMKYEDFIYALIDHPDVVEDVMKVIDEMYDPLYEQLTSFAVKNKDDKRYALTILNFGENIAMAYLSPEYFEKYCIPWYEKRVSQLRKAGIFTHIHIDGYFKPLLPYLKHLPFDGLEALTPKPQGDVTIEEMHGAMGDKILLDGIPAVSFLPHHSMEDLEAQTKKLIKLFHPRLVLGISDELPEAVDEQGFDRMKWVSEFCRSQGKPKGKKPKH